MSELVLPRLGRTYTFGDDVTLEEAAAEVRGRINPDVLGTPVGNILNSMIDSAVASANPSQFAIDRGLVGEAFAGVRRGVESTFGTAVRGFENVPEQLIGSELFDGYFNDFGSEIIEGAARDASTRPGRDYEELGKVGEAVGSMLGFVAGAGAGVAAGAAITATTPLSAPVSLFGLGTSALLGSLVVGDEGYQRAIEAGASPEDVRAATLMSAALGTLEAAVPGRMFGLIAGGGKLGALTRRYNDGIIDEAGYYNQLNNISQEVGTLKRYAQNVLIDAGLEGSQEAFQAVGQDLIERYVYNPDKTIDSFEALEQGLYGGSAGAILSGITSAFKVRGARGSVQRFAQNEQAIDAQAQSNLQEEINDPALSAQVANLPGNVARQLSGSATVLPTEIDAEAGTITEGIILPEELPERIQEIILETLPPGSIISASPTSSLAGEVAEEAASEVASEVAGQLADDEEPKVGPISPTQTRAQTRVAEAQTIVEKFRANQARAIEREELLETSRKQGERPTRFDEKKSEIVEQTRVIEGAPKSKDVDKDIDNSFKGLDTRIKAVLPGISALSSPTEIKRQVTRFFGKDFSDQTVSAEFRNSKSMDGAAVNKEYVAALGNVVSKVEAEQKRRTDFNNRVDKYADKLGLLEADKQERVQKLQNTVASQVTSENQDKITDDIKKLAGDDVNVGYGKGTFVNNLYNKFVSRGRNDEGGSVVGGFAIPAGKVIMIDKNKIKPGETETNLLVGEEAFHIIQGFALTESESKILEDQLTPELAEANGIDLSAYPDGEMRKKEAQAKLAAKAYAEGIDSIKGLKKKGFVKRILAKIKKALESLVSGLQDKNIADEYTSVDQILRAFIGGELARPSELRQPNLIESKNLDEIYASAEQSAPYIAKRMKDAAKFVDKGMPKGLGNQFKDLAAALGAYINTFGNAVSQYAGLKNIGRVTREIEERFNNVIVGVEDILSTGFLERHTPQEKTQVNGLLHAARTIMEASTQPDTPLDAAALRELGITNEQTIEKILSDLKNVTIEDFFNQDIVHPTPGLGTFRIDSGTQLADTANKLRGVFDFIFDKKVDAFLEVYINEINRQLAKDDIKPAGYITIEDIKDPDSFNAMIEDLKSIESVSEKLINDFNDLRTSYRGLLEQRKLLYMPAMRKGRFGFKYKFTDRFGVEREGFKLVDDPEFIKDAQRNAQEKQNKFFTENPDYTRDGGVFELTYNNFVSGLKPADSTMVINMMDSSAVASHLADNAEGYNEFREQFARKFASATGKRLLPPSSSIPGDLTKDNLSTYLSQSFNQYVSSQANMIGRMPLNKELQKELEAIRNDDTIPQAYKDLAQDTWGEDGYVSQQHRLSDRAKRVAFTWWLGGNLSSAGVNLTSLFHTTMPFIMSIAKNPAEGTAALIKGFKLASKLTKEFPLSDPKKAGMSRGLQFLDFANKPFDLRKKPAGMNEELFGALQRALPILAPVQLSDVSGQLSQQPLIAKSKILRAAEIGIRGSGFAFAWVEQFNRFATAISAYEVYKKDPAKAKLMFDAEGKNRYGEFNLDNFIQFSVEKTQFKFDKTDRPRYNRGPILGVVTQFLPYQTQVMRYFFKALKDGFTGAGGFDENGNPIKLDAETRKIYKRMALLSGLAFATTGGIIGIPAVAIIGDLVAMINSIWEDDEDPETMLTDMLYDFGLPQEVALALAYRGLPSLVGLELGKRTGIEGPRGLLQIVSGDREASLPDFFGPAGGIVGQLSNVGRRLNAGDYDLATVELFPPVFRNILLAAQGSRRVTMGGRELPIEAFGGVDLFDIAIQAAGFTPTSIVEARNVTWQQIKAEQNYNARSRSYRNALKNTFVELYIANANGDSEEVEIMQGEIRAIMEEVNQHNIENPSEPIRIDMGSVTRSAMQDFRRAEGIDVPVDDLPLAIRRQFQERYLDRNPRYQRSQALS